MTLKFQSYFFAAFCTLLLLEIGIALFLKTGFIRHTVGDFLVVILLYCFIKSFLDLKIVCTALSVLFIAYGIEFLQLYNILTYLNLRGNTMAGLILGTSFSIQDLVAYALGVMCIAFIDLKISKSRQK
ncbi:DUF2809 domain-containing protein [Lacinutrix neustonica]|uniref:DUF2809 domain-containing protein n=1 Tax=Lacinutrix neustonica TaxID=2980107 RepID=A0A9E8MZY6_9FLAO|nr:DUF2809 domain-containing protein [Lacinutrix neustonica]WAC03359.1 DUF2809 domain-containing protein [Lacinutrix neustonica]